MPLLVPKLLRRITGQLKSFNLLVLFPSGSLIRTKHPNPPSIFSEFAKEIEGRALAEEKKKRR